MKSLRDLGHRLEEANQYEKLRTYPNPSNTGSSNNQKTKKGKMDGSQKADKPSGSSDKNTASRKDPKVELAGIPKELLDSRSKAHWCLKCGKADHQWRTCPEKEPVKKVIATTNKKRKRAKCFSPVPDTKKPKTVASLESCINLSSADKPQLNIVDDEDSDDLRIYDW
jgi:hypothetical protein